MAASGKPRLETQQRWRDTIKTTLILEKLNKHTTGSECMSQAQVQAAKILLAKTMPDLKQIEHSGEIANPVQAINLNIKRG